MHTDVRALDPYKTQSTIEFVFFLAQRSVNNNNVNTKKLIPYAEPCVQRQLIQSLKRFLRNPNLQRKFLMRSRT